MGACCGKRKHSTDSGDNGMTSNLNNYNTGSKRLLKDENSIIHSVADKEDFATQLASAGDKLVVVDFFATWCRPCAMINPKVEAMAAEFADVLFLKVDVNECEDVTTEYAVQSMPTFIFLKKSEKVDEFSGANEEKLRDIIKAKK